MAGAQTSRNGRSNALLRCILLAAVLALLPIWPATAAPAQPISRDPRFGMNEAWRAADAADRAGAGWSRILFWWSELQKSGPGDIDPFATDQDRYIDAEVARGRDLAAGVLNTPRWASTDGTANGVPKNLYLPWDHPENHWGQLMRKLGERYKGRIDTWIIWNEVDISHGQWNTWNGSVEDYAQLLKVAYRAVKSVNPNATVMPYGAAYWYDRGVGMQRLLDVLSADPEAKRFNHYFDVANIHLYSRASDIPAVIAWYREQLELRGMKKPIWVAEMNAIPYDDPVRPMSKANFRASQDEQASYIIQAFATYLALDVKRVSVNRAVDGTDFEAGGEPFGMLRNDGTARPAYKAYQVVTRYFSNVLDAEYHPSEHLRGPRGVVLNRENERVIVVWTMSDVPQTVMAEAKAKRALRVTKYGETRTVEAKDGKYVLDLEPATGNSNEYDNGDFVVGGEPVILVERLDGNTELAFRSLEVVPAPRPR